MSEPTLEDLRPRQWSVAWEYNRIVGVPHDRWNADDRVWDDQDKAVEHARALLAMEHATGEIRNITIHLRHAPLEASEWEELALNWWIE